MRQKIAIAIVICFFSYAVLGQNSYYKTDSSKVVGAAIADGGPYQNSRVCKIRSPHGEREYTAEEVIEYRLRDGKFYRSFNIDPDNKESHFFLERLSNTEEIKFHVYYLALDRNTKSFYIQESDSTELQVLDWDNKKFVDQLVKQTNDSALSAYLRWLKPKRNSVKLFTSDYNNGKMRPLPRIRTSALGGFRAVSFSSLTGEGDFAHVPDQYLWTSVFGLGIDLPLKSSNMSFHTEFLIHNMDLLLNWEYQNSTYVQYINLSAFSVPILFRYSFYGRNLSPYFQTGVTYSMALNNTGTNFRFTSIQNDVYARIEEFPVIPDQMLGPTFAGGLIFKYNSRLSLFGEIRFNTFFPIFSESATLKYKDIQLLIGILL